MSKTFFLTSWLKYLLEIAFAKDQLLSQGSNPDQQGITRNNSRIYYVMAGNFILFVAILASSAVIKKPKNVNTQKQMSSSIQKYEHGVSLHFFPSNKNHFRIWELTNLVTSCQASSPLTNPITFGKQRHDIIIFHLIEYGFFQISPYHQTLKYNCYQCLQIDVMCMVNMLHISIVS